MQKRCNHETNMIQPWCKHDANMMQWCCKHVRNVFRTRFENGQKMVRTRSKQVWNMFWTCWQHVQKNIFFEIFLHKMPNVRPVSMPKNGFWEVTMKNGEVTNRPGDPKSHRWTPKSHRKIRGEHTGEFDCAKVISIRDAHFFNRVASRTLFPWTRNEMTRN